GSIDDDGIGQRIRRRNGRLLWRLGDIDAVGRRCAFGPCAPQHKLHLLAAAVSCQTEQLGDVRTGGAGDLAVEDVLELLWIKVQLPLIVDGGPDRGDAVNVAGAWNNVQ